MNRAGLMGVENTSVEFMNTDVATMSNAEVPRPRRRLLKTLFRRPRNLRKLVEPLSIDAVRARMPSVEEAAHWGEVILLEDHVNVLHRDGTLTYGIHYISMLHGDQNLAAWEQALWYYQTSAWRPTVHHAILRSPEGWQQKATVTDRLVDQAKTRLMHIVFGHLRRGVIADLSYQMDHFRPQPPGPCSWGQFCMQTASPCRHRRYTIAVAEPFSAQIELHHGAAAPAISDVDEYTVYRWEQLDVPGIEWDAWTPPLRDHAPWIDFTTLPTWEPVATQFRKDLAAGDSPAVHSLVRQLTRAARTDGDKIRAIYRYVAEQVRYGRPPHQLYMPASRPVSQMFEDLRGDCKDKSTLLASMLRSADIRADIAVVSTRIQGLAPYLPAPRFDHALVVAELDGKRLWLDTAAGPMTFGDVPYNDQGIRALILAKDCHDYVESPPPRPEDHGAHWQGTGELDEQGNHNLHLKFTAKGDRASFLRLTVLHRNQDYRARVLKQTLVRGVPGAVVTELRTSPLDDLTAALECECRVRVPGCSRIIDRLLMIQVPWVEPVYFDGPVAARERPQPLAAPLVQMAQEHYEIALPYAGLTLASESFMREQCDWAVYEQSHRLENQRLICERKLSILGGIVPPQRQEEYQRFWAACARFDSAPVVLNLGKP